ncbi:MAG TPA: hypothetical protein VFZ14_14030 [Burkholderiales bacterium]|jgi:hypothetical protein|nr:hypothetical protein [Burkholderiales bacterium]
MIVTDTFAQFGRRMSATQGCPYVTIAQTPNPIRQLEPEALRARAEAMIETIIEGLTRSPREIEQKLKDRAAQEIRPAGVVRSSVPV